MFSIVDAVNAIFVRLVRHRARRAPRCSGCRGRRAARRTTRSGVTCDRRRPRVPESIAMAAAYAAWASRYLHEYGVDTRARSAASRSTAAPTRAQNPLAAIRTPMTLDDYYAARMIREPLCMLDMDLPVDGADAFVLTTAERGEDAAASAGARPRDGHRPRRPERRGPAPEPRATTASTSSSSAPGQERHLDRRRRRLLPVRRLHDHHDAWIENTGWCGPGEAGAFLARALGRRDRTASLIDGRVPVNPHGGSLSEGATRGTGHLREAVVQLRGRSGRAPGRRRAQAALVTPGGFFFNSQGAVLRAG